MTRGTVSVVMPLRNGAPYVAEAIESVLSQSYPPREVVVVDDGSSDGGADVVRSFVPEVRLAVQDHAGPGAARNHGVRLAHGEYLAFLDADDRFVPGKLERQVQALVAEPGLDLVFGELREFAAADLRAPRRLREPSGPRPARLVGTMLVRRSSFLRVGPFPEGIRRGETLDWVARAEEAGLRSSQRPGVVLERRLHRTNTGLLGGEEDYLKVVRWKLQRRRAAAREGGAPGADGSPA